MSDLHRFVGYAVVGIFSIGWLAGLALWVARRQAAEWFWRWLVAAQVVAIVQALVGTVLLLLGRRSSDWLHYVYGYGPILILAVAHALARDENFRRRPWVPFALASFICFGLTLRALMTGLGIG
ncbi:MAG: hypothetical protein ACXWX6_05530 [Actinomycetota bacterium]